MWVSIPNQGLAMEYDVQSPKRVFKRLVRLLPILGLVIYPPLQTYFLLSEQHLGMDSEVLSFFRLLFGLSIIDWAAISAKRFFDVFANR